MVQNNETYTSQRKAEIAGIQARICDLLRWDEMQYNEFIMDSGNEFIELYYRAVPELIPLVKRSRVFWNWWKVIWWNDDEIMLTFIIPTGYTRSDIFDLYCRMHITNPDHAAQLPPRTVWDDVKKIQKQMSWA